MSEKSLDLVRTFRDRSTQIIASNGVIQYWTTISAEQTDCFALGAARLSPDARGAIAPPDSSDLPDRDHVVLVSHGELAIEFNDGQLRRLNQYDVAYAPAGTAHQIRNVGHNDAWTVWATVPPSGESVVPPRVINTFAEVEEGTGVDEDDIKRYWIPISASHLGIEHFELGIIFRPPGTEVPLHRHDPLETKEAFIVLDGTMLVEGFEGRTYELSDYDGLYVPPGGQHSNRNIGSETLRYVFIESPAEPDLEFL